MIKPGEILKQTEEKLIVVICNRRKVALSCLVKGWKGKLKEYYS